MFLGIFCSETYSPFSAALANVKFARVQKYFIDFQTDGKVSLDPDALDQLQIRKADFDFALENDIKPSFGANIEDFESYVANGMHSSFLVLLNWYSCYLRFTGVFVLLEIPLYLLNHLYLHFKVLSIGDLLSMTLWETADCL